MRRTLVLIVIMVVFGASGLAQQTEDPWNAVKALRKGQKVRIVEGGFLKSEGKFVAADDATLRYEFGSREVTLDRESVRLVSVQKGSRASQILLGVLAGALIGASYWAHINSCERHGCLRSDYTWYEGSGKGLPRNSAYVFTGVGAGTLGIFAAFTGKAHQVIYTYDPPAPYIETPIEPIPDPMGAGQPEGGNVFVPVRPPGLAELPLERNYRDLFSDSAFLP
jgi:hypothetical protein